MQTLQLNYVLIEITLEIDFFDCLDKYLIQVCALIRKAVLCSQDHRQHAGDVVLPDPGCVCVYVDSCVHRIIDNMPMTWCYLTQDVCLCGRLCSQDHRQHAGDVVLPDPGRE